MTRAILHYHATLEGFPTIYDTCPTECKAPEADQANGCPNCRVIVARDAFRRGAEREMTAAVEKHYEGQPPPVSLWSLDDLIRDYKHANALVLQFDEGFPDDVDELTLFQIEIIREEKYLRRRLEDEIRRKEFDES